jgi:hypothetical protein
MFGYSPAEAQALSVTQLATAAQDKFATSYQGRQTELKITAAVAAVAGLLTKSATLMKVSVAPGGHPKSPTCGHPKIPHLNCS